MLQLDRREIGLRSADRSVTVATPVKPSRSTQYYEVGYLEPWATWSFDYATEWRWRWHAGYCRPRFSLSHDRRGSAGAARSWWRSARGGAPCLRACAALFSARAPL